MLNELLRRQRGLLDHYYDHLDLKQLEHLVQLIINCPGLIFFSGVGKSGLVANKIALTMVSTGTRASYLAPIEAMHGDIGMVSKGDIFIMFSKSGESDELLSLVPAVKNKGATLISVICTPTSRLGRASDFTIILPFETELCPFDLVPTMSTAYQLLFGDLLAIALMTRKGFTMSEYALNHPSGRIGKRITLKVKDVMLVGDKIPLCGPSQKLEEVLVELSNKRCGCVLIVDEEQKLKGIFTDGDLRRTLQKHGPTALQQPMEVIMSANPRSISSGLMAWDAMQLMESDYKRRITALPVIDDDGKAVGLIHLHDIIQIGL